MLLRRKRSKLRQHFSSLLLKHRSSFNCITIIFVFNMQYQSLVEPLRCFNTDVQDFKVVTTAENDCEMVVLRCHWYFGMAYYLDGTCNNLFLVPS